jgi:hypothetical protein
MMKKILFKYKEHPGDLFRNTDVIELPNPDNNLEDFLICFLDNYQSDKRIAHIDDLSKLVENEFLDENEKERFENFIGNKTQEELLSEIELIENELKAEAFRNFYNLLLSNKIEIVKAINVLQMN